MPALTPELRNKIERAIIEARDAAEAGAKAALEALAVHHYDPYPHQTPELRKLRNHLRAHARLLGDRQDSSGKLHIGHLIHECAYEHWHRMLFARFLAETDLLIEPDSQVAISLQECEELAKKAHIDLWTFASRCAQQMLPQIFRPDDPLLKVTLAREHKNKLETLLNDIPPAVFKADDALGWVYQFWQSKKKDEVNASGEKITGDTLPAVTQLFTEHYMVLFLLHNTIGAWHAGKVLAANPKLAETVADEAELRRAVALKAAGGYSFDYLRFVRGPDGKGGPWRPAAGTFEGWPKRAAELKVLDPCCGSGHFLVAVLALLLRLRMDEEGLSLSQAADAVLRDNIFGLELDARCTQIAAFNLALAAWRRGGYRPLPSLHIACSGLAPNTTEQEWVSMAGENTRLRAGMERLYRLFQQAPTLGSLIDPRLDATLLEASYDELLPLLEKALSTDGADQSAQELAVAAKGIAKAAEILAGHFTLVITNVPYLGYREMDEMLLAHVARFYSSEKGDLGYCLWRRFHGMTTDGSCIALVTLQHWASLRSYTGMRKNLFAAFGLPAVAHLGVRAFETITGEKVNVTLTIALRSPTPMRTEMTRIDVAGEKNAHSKAYALKVCPLDSTQQQRQYANPDHRISFGELQNQPPLSRYADCLAGIMNGDSPKFIRKYWELPQRGSLWSYLQSTVPVTQPVGGLESMIFFDDENGHLREDAAIRRQKLHNADERGNSVWGRCGVAVSQMSNLPVAGYFGDKYDSNVATIVPRRDQDLPAIWAFCSSEAFRASVRAIDRKLNVTNATFGKIPFDLAHWQRIAEANKNGLPERESNDPTQWLFHGQPEHSTNPVQVAVARLLGYRWPAELDNTIQLSPRARDLLRESRALLKFAEDSGIVCIPSVRGENPAADRLATLLASCGIKPGRDLDDWLRNSFFEEHCKLFHHRPFIWHIWDGRKRDGFHALVNYHKLAEGDGKGRKLLESLTYSYLGEWINRQQDGVKRGEDGAEDRLAAAMELQKRLEAILKGEPPFDIFVRWKPLQQQPIGWEPDINDGVRLNIRPFLADDLPNGRAGAGVLRWRPNIKWDKDRGKEPHRPKAEFPWFWGWDEETENFLGGKDFTGERFNACHYRRRPSQIG